MGSYSSRIHLAKLNISAAALAEALSVAGGRCEGCEQTETPGLPGYVPGSWSALRIPAYSGVMGVQCHKYISKSCQDSESPAGAGTAPRASFCFRKSHLRHRICDRSLMGGSLVLWQGYENVFHFCSFL